MTVVITDSTILIIFSKTDLLDILFDFYGKILILVEVYNEVVVRGKITNKEDAFYIEDRIMKELIQIIDIKDFTYSANIQKDFNIHKGEAECIVLFFESSGNLLGTDDKKTLNVCKIFQIPFFSTISFLLLCVSKRKLSKSQASLKLDKLLQIGWYNKSIIESIKEKITNIEVN